MKPLLYMVILVSLLVQPACRHGAPTASEPSNNSSSDSLQNAESAKNDAQLLLDKGNELYKDDRDSEAADAFSEAIKIDPSLAEAHYKLGLADLALGKKKEAEEAFSDAVDTYEKYVEKNPKDADAFFNLGEAYSNLHQYEDAIDAYKSAAKLNPDDADTFFELGMAQSKLARYDEAVVSLRKATDLDPDNFRAGEALEKAREDQKRIQVSQKRQEEALKKKESETNANSNKSNSTTASPTPTKQASPATKSPGSLT